MMDFSGLARAWLFSIVAAAVVGWALIEGSIWLFRHLTLGWTG
jgi:hypothetical protein